MVARSPVLQVRSLAWNGEVACTKVPEVVTRSNAISFAALAAAGLLFLLPLVTAEKFLERLPDEPGGDNPTAADGSEPVR